jgi:hypothetical protein
MAEHQDIGRVAAEVGEDRGQVHRRNNGVDQPDLVACVDQRPADLQKTERWQKLTRDTAADRPVRRVEKDDPGQGQDRLDITAQVNHGPGRIATATAGGISLQPCNTV